MIDSFQGRYRFLSNFYPAEVRYHGEVYATVEHAYQAAKTDDPHERELIRKCASPGRAKRAGRMVTMRPEWDSVKKDVMLELLRQKFYNNLALKQMLLDTRDEELVEGNDWGDTFWGQCFGSGENWLGKLLMIVREEL